MVLNVCVPPLEDQERQSRLDQVLSCGLACREVRVVRRAEELELRPGGRLLFALALDGAGQNSEYQRMLARLRLEPGLPGASSWTAPGSCTPSPPPPSWP